MRPDWLRHEKTLAPLRKKEAKRDFVKLWGSNPKYAEAFKEIQALLAKNVVLHHIDYEAAEAPAESGRPLELFVDASDIGWCATLYQRLEQHGAPKIVSMICKGFKDVEVRWSAMERELYALWRGVVEHE